MTQSSDKTAPYMAPGLIRDKVADRVRFVLTRYFSRKAQVADIIYNDAILNTGFPVPSDFALAFYAENSLKPGESRKIRLKINGKRYDALLQRPGAAWESEISYNAQSEVARYERPLREW
jgi:hypothetical protein